MRNAMAPRPAEAPKPLDGKEMYASLEGFRVLGILTPEYNCCVQKVIGEMAPYLKQRGIAPAMGFDDDPKRLVESFPEWVIYLRTGVKQGEPVQHLAQCDAFINYYRSLGIDVTYYLDDALFFINNMAPLKLIWNCDRVIVATDVLAQFLIERQKYPKPIYVIKTHMDIPTFDTLPRPTYLIDPDRYNILFTSQGRVGALMIHRIMKYMNEHPEKYKDVNFIIVSAFVAQMRTILNQFRNVRKKYWEWMPLTEHYGLTKAVDLILAPGEEADLEGQVDTNLQNFWLHAKSCVKYTLAGAASLPIISTPLYEYEKAITHEKTGFLAKDLDEWMHYIDWCLNNREAAKQIGENARRDVEEKWHIFHRADQWANLLINNSDECLLHKVDHDKPAEGGQNAIGVPTDTLPTSADISK